MSRERAPGQGIGVLLAAALWFGAACQQGDGSHVVSVVSRDLVIDVEVTGTLRPRESELVGPPPAVTDLRQFKIIRMLPEGTRIKAGDEVLAFDPSELEKQLKDSQSKIAEVSEEIGELRAEGRLNALGKQQELQKAEARQHKAELLSSKPAELLAEQHLQTARIERDLAQREVGLLREQGAAAHRQSAADVAILESNLADAKRRAEEIRQEIAALAVRARREGVVAYKQSPHGEKKRVGEDVWRSEFVLEIASLASMAAQGQVDEIDASQVAVGQEVRLRLEVQPDKEYAGRVERMGRIAKPESAESRLKVVQLDIKLEAVDPLLMRPGMRFRGRIEIARIPNAVQIPLAAIESTPNGPVVSRPGDRGTTPVRLGRRSREEVEIREGLRPGDRVRIPERSAPEKGRNDALRLGGS